MSHGELKWEISVEDILDKHGITDEDVGYQSV